MKLNLERLNDRIVPAIMLDWNPVGTDNLFHEAKNWTVTSTGLQSTNSPGPGYVCNFPTSAGSICKVSGSDACDAIQNANWPGDLEINGVLHIWGVNGSDSFWKRGTIKATGTDDKVNIMGGQFSYNIGYMNNFAETTMTYYVSQNAELHLKQSNVVFNASIEVGKDSLGVSSPGTFNVMTSNVTALKKNTENTNLLKVYSNSTANIYTGGINASRIENNGYFNLNGGLVKTVAAEGGTFNSLGGRVTVADSSAYLIYGNLYLENSTLRMGNSYNNYSNLTVLGNLEFGANSVYSVDVNRNSIWQADATEADNITIATNAVLVTYSDANPTIGNHQHKILYGVDSLNGMFGTLNNYGTGGLCTTWVTDYVTNPKKLFLILPPLEDDEGPPM